MFRRALKPAVIGASSAVAVGVYALAADAPMADKGDGKYVHRRKTTFPEWVHNLARVPLFLGATAGSKFSLQVLNSFHEEGAEIFRRSLEERPPGVPLITVSNHSATVDDPGVLAA